MEIKTGQNYALTKDLAKKARLLALSGDETRLRILCLMFQNAETCVTDVAGSLKLSIALASHHLRVLKDEGLLTSCRKGSSICYAIKDSQFARDLKSLICH